MKKQPLCILVMQILLLALSSCSVFELQEEETAVSGMYFKEDAACDLHFSTAVSFLNTIRTFFIPMLQGKS